MSETETLHEKWMREDRQPCKRPWAMNEFAKAKGSARVTCPGGTVAECGPECRASEKHFANAALIVRAVNAHDALREACEAAANELTRLIEAGNDAARQTLATVCAALALARGN